MPKLWSHCVRNADSFEIGKSGCTRERSETVAKARHWAKTAKKLSAVHR